MPYDNLYQEQHPIMGPLLRAWQLYNIDQDNKRAQSALDLQKQQFDAGERQRQIANQQWQKDYDRLSANDQFNRDKFNQEQAYTRRQDSLKQAQDANNLGWQQVHDLGEFWFHTKRVPDVDPKTGKQKVNALGIPLTRVVGNQGQFIPNIDGSQGGYVMPTEAQAFNRNLLKMIGLGQIEGMNAFEKLRAMLPGRIAEANAKANFAEPKTFQNDEGVVTGINPYTGQPVYTTAPIGTTKQGAKKNDLATQAEGERAKVQGLIDKARHNDALIQTLRSSPNFTKEQSNMLAKAVAASQYLWDEALRSANNAVKKYPQHLKGGAGQGGYAWIDSIPQDAGAAPGAPPMRFPLNWGPQR